MRSSLSAALLASTMLALPTPALAQDLTAQDVAAMRAEIAALRAQVETLEARLDAVDTAPLPAPVVTPVKPQAEISWKGAPEIKTADGWSFKPRGRAQVDLAAIDAPAGVLGTHGGVGTEFRRVYLGVDGKIPGGFAYRVEADLANSSVELTDIYISYATGPLTVTAGQIKPFWSLEEMTSDLFTSFTERAAFTQAFGFERRVGLSAQLKGSEWLLQGGVFGNNANDLLSDSDNSVSFDGRAIWMPKWGSSQLHLGGSAHMRKANAGPGAVRYAARPFVHTTNSRFVDTGTFTTTGERGLGLEAAIISGPFHATGEAFWQTARRPGLVDPTFFGGYVEAGWVLTRGDARGYKDGGYDRLNPSRPISAGGPGAIEVNARYDYLDLEDSGIAGGRQRTAGVSLVWAPIAYIRIVANYGHVMVDNGALASLTGDRSYSADAFALRTQIDF